MENRHYVYHVKDSNYIQFFGTTDELWYAEGILGFRKATDEKLNKHERFLISNVLRNENN